jgi:glycosyltransferase involved in cell wall biosynthesis
MKQAASSRVRIAFQTAGMRFHVRVLHVNKFLYRRGGAEAYMLDVATLQRAAGHEVEFFGMAHPENSQHRFAAQFPGSVQLEPPPPGLHRRMKAVARMVYSPSSRRGMEEVLRSFRPDVVHLHNIYHQLSPSVLRPLAEHGTPAVMTLHDYKLVCPSYLLLSNGKICEACLDGNFFHAVTQRCKEGSLAKSAALALESTVHRAMRAYEPVQVFICPSRFMAAKMTEGGVYPERLQLLRNFADTRSVAPKASSGGPIVYAGRLAHEKGVDVLIEAVARLGRDRLEVAGEGPERARLEALAADRAPGRVRFHGRLSKEQLLGLLRSAAVVAIPSRCHENQPMILLEAFACGVPVVATRLGGLPELVRPGENGDTVPPDEPGSLADALAGLLADPDRAFLMGRAAREMAEADLGPDRHGAALEELYGLAQDRAVTPGGGDSAPHPRS